MITIKKEGETVLCSKNTYEIMYKRLGYEIVNPIEKATITRFADKEIKNQETEIENDEIPVIEMKENKKNVKETSKTSSKEKTITKTKNNKSK